MQVARADAIQNYKLAEGWLADSISTGDAFYEYREGSIFLYPTPTENVTNGLKVYAIKALIDLVAGSAETTVFPKHMELRQYHHLIALGAVPYVLRHRNVDI